MSFSLIPDYSFDRVCHVTPEFVRQRGITTLFLDLDNTLAPYGTVVPPEDIAAWVENIKRCGIDLFIITNNRGSERVASLAAAFGIDYIMGANKPFPTGVRRALAQLDTKPEETALIGDQIFTDVIAANSGGIISIVVQPLKIRNPALNLRYWLEAPFRALCKNKMR